MVLTLLPPHRVHKLYETTGSSNQFFLSEDISQMETMSYPCSPLIPFPTQHEESSYLLWSPQVVIPLENGNMRDGDGDANPFPDQQQQDHEFMDMIIQEANRLPLQDDFPNVDPLLAGFDQRLEGQENGSLLAVQQEEFMAESSLSDLLVAGARAVEAQDSIGASAILSRLDDLIPGVPHRSCHHAAALCSSDHLTCYFARGLRCRISGGARAAECHPAAAPAAPANRMPACRMLQELSPFIKFAHFTANQAILEATADDPGVHVVDLNAGEGFQWASLMSDLSRHGGKPFHLTAVVTESDAAGAHPTAARWLSEFAESLNLPFRYSSLHLRSEEDLHGFTTTGNGGGSVIVSCDTTDRSYSSLIRLQMQLLGSVKILQPKLVILIEQELFRIGRNLAPFAEFFYEVLQHFAAMLESLESCFGDGGYGACLGLMEKEMLGPMIEDTVRQYGSLTGGSGAELEGFRACELSSFNVAQGKMLAGLFSRGFGVVQEEGRLALCWNSRPLTSVSVWSPV